MVNTTSFAYASAVVSAVDVALWDIKGKALGIPVYQLLGGRYRQDIRLYPHLRGTWNSYPDETTQNVFSEPWGGTEYTPEQLGQNALELVREGYDAIKFDPFAPGRDGYHSYHWDEIVAVADRVEAIRSAVGDQVDLLVECHSRFNASTAIKIGKLLEKYNLMWIEDPVPAGAVKSLKKVSDHLNTPIAACERLNSKMELKDYLEAGAVDIVMFDIGKVGGISEAMKIAAMCEAYQVKASPHNPFGPVCAVASAHLSTAIYPFLIQEHEQMAPWAIEPPLEIVDGRLKVPESPGLGVELNEEAIAEVNAKIAEGTYKSYTNDSTRDFPY